MRLLHTSDWHLGHTLKEVTREYEHQAFLTWLLEQLRLEAPDVMIITGDVFDSATPPASAERMWFELLAAARRAQPAMEIVAIAGNHDSPARLGASASVLRELGVFVVGSLPRGADGGLDFDRILIPVASGRGLVAAVPFVRPVDVGDGEDPLAVIYQEVVAEAERRRAAGQALIVMGHLYVAGADPSHLSERRISIGGQESASLRMFPPEIDYVALGHMHRAQRVGRESIRYAGAPIALALDEAGYHHQIAIVDFADGRLASVRTTRVPQTIEIVRIPARGAVSLDGALEAIAALPARREGDDFTRPYLDLMIALERPEPRLRTMIEQALEGKRARLVQMRIERTGDGAALGDRIAVKRLAELDPREVFTQLWARDHADAPSAAVVGAFERLLAEVRGDLADPAKPVDAPQLRLGGV
ncbi:MAG: exonuclease SbcCD subunit D C-terminal domain-containing protein [Kofleriaceae bacterium]